MECLKGMLQANIRQNLQVEREVIEYIKLQTEPPGAGREVIVNIGYFVSLYSYLIAYR